MILGAILAGGRASRFGSDKAMAMLDGRPLIDHVAVALSREVDRTIVCGRAYSGLISIPDRTGSSLGPLGGIDAALRYAADNGFAKVLTAPCDTPRISKDLLTVLLAASAPVYLSSLPVMGCWPSTLADQLDAYLDNATDLSIRRWARTIDATMLDHRAPLNINAREDLDLLAGGD